ncbi:MAG TPA: HrpE/YscL family type III secretion apparatus protein [Candidatus Methylacidiphilales bacterium]|nr:HrpE/YscL family type III secretion apparatus protein [Candidatus Methylacidiphilales bacterium]
MLRITEKSLRSLPNQRVLKPDDYAALLTAEKLLADAHAEAERLRAEAIKVFESEKKRGYEAGLDEGREQIATQLMETAMDSVTNMAAMEERIVDVVVRSLKKILGDMDNREVVVKVVQRALEMVRNQKQVLLRVSPGDVTSVQERLDELMRRFPAIDVIDVKADSRLKAGGCILETDVGMVEASVDVQVEAIKNALLNSIRAANAA